MNEQEQDLTPTMQELMAQMARLQAELDNLKAHASALPPPVQKEKPGVSTTRRKVLRQLAGGLVAGLVVAGIGVTNPNEAEAKLSSNPSGNGLTGRVGMLVMPPGGSVSGTMGGVAGTKVGILVSGNTSFNIDPSVIGPTVNSAIIAYDSNNGTPIVGLSQTGIAILAQSNNNYGIRGTSTTSHGVYGSTSNTSLTAAAGVLGTSTGNSDAGVKGTNDNNGAGVRGESNNGYGVWGISNVMGVRGESNNGSGVFGGTTNGYAIFGDSAATGYAGYFGGKVQITGNLSKGGGSFKIDHPLDPEHKYLYHSFVESPDMMNIYNALSPLISKVKQLLRCRSGSRCLTLTFVTS